MKKKLLIRKQSSWRKILVMMGIRLSDENCLLI